MIGKMVFFIISLIISGLTCYLASLMRASGIKDKRISGLFTLYLALPFWIILSAATAVVDPAYYYAFNTAKTVCVAVIPYMTLWFVLHFIESRLAQMLLVRNIFIVIAGTDVLMLLTNPLHGLYYTNHDTIPPTQGMFPQVHLLLSTCVILAVYALLLRYIIKNYKKRPVLILTGVGVIIPIALNIMYRYNLFGVHYDFSAAGYFCTLVTYTYASFGYRFRKAKPGQLSETLARIAKSRDVTDGSVEDAAGLITWESCLALDTSRIGIWRFDDDAQTMNNLISFDSATGEYFVQAAIEINRYPKFMELLKSDGIAVVNDISNPGILDDFYESFTPDICSVISAAIMVDGRLTGIICIEQNRCDAYPERREWNNDERTFVSSIADLMAICISSNERRESVWRMETELSKSVGFAGSAISNAPIAVTLFDEDFNVLSCNDTAVSMFEISMNIYRNNFQTISPEYQPDGESSVEKFKKLMEQVKEDKKVRFEWTHCTQSGRLIPCEVTVIAVTPDDSQNYLAYVYDMTNAKEMQEKLRKTSEELEAALQKANEASKAKTDFLAKMSHEMRTPMNTIIGFTELAMRNYNDADEVKEYIFSIKQASADLLVIIDDILEIIKINAGEAELEKYLAALSKPTDYTQTISSKVASDSRKRDAGGEEEFKVSFTAPDAHVLIVDDLTLNLRVAEGLLTPYNMHIDTCNNGAVAIAAVHTAMLDEPSRHYDLVLMDHMMPDMDGLETAQHMRKLGIDIPIVALTADAIPEVKEMLLENGFNDFIPKPIDVAHLDAVLGKWIPEEKKR